MRLGPRRHGPKRKIFPKIGYAGKNALHIQFSKNLLTKHERRVGGTPCISKFRGTEWRGGGADIESADAEGCEERSGWCAARDEAKG